MKFLDSAPFVLARACTASDGRFDTSFDRHRPLCTLCTRIFTHRMHRIGCGADRVMRVLLVLLRLLRLPFACSLKIVHETRLFVWQLSHRLSVSLVRCATASRVFVLVYVLLFSRELIERFLVCGHYIGWAWNCLFLVVRLWFNGNKRKYLFVHLIIVPSCSEELPLKMYAHKHQFGS